MRIARLAALGPIVRHLLTVFRRYRALSSNGYFKSKLEKIETEWRQVMDYQCGERLGAHLETVWPKTMFRPKTANGLEDPHQNSSRRPYCRSAVAARCVGFQGRTRKLVDVWRW